MIEQALYTEHPEVLVEDHLALRDEAAPFGLNLIETLTFLARHKRLILMATCASGLVGLLYCFTLPTLYTSTTKIMPPQQPQSSAALLMSQLTNNGGGSLASAAGSGLGLKSANDTYVGLLNSRTIADAIIEKFELTKAYRSSDMTAARKMLATNTKVSSEKSGFLVVSVTDRDKGRAADMANAYTEELRALNRTLAVTEAAQRRLFYEEQLKRAKEDLITAEESFQLVQQKKGLVQLDAQAKVLIESLASVQAQVTAKQVELQSLRSYSTELNPNVQMAKSQLASLQAQASQLEQHSRSQGSTGIGLQDVAVAGLDYLRAQHDLQYRQILFDLLLKQYDAARLDEAKDAAVIQVVEPAIVADRKSSPQRSLIVLLFAFLGGFGACLYLHMRAFAENHPEISRSLLQFRLALLAK